MPSTVLKTLVTLTALASLASAELVIISDIAKCYPADGHLSFANAANAAILPAEFVFAEDATETDCVNLDYTAFDPSNAPFLDIVSAKLIDTDGTYTVKLFSDKNCMTVLAGAAQITGLPSVRNYDADAEVDTATDCVSLISGFNNHFGGVIADSSFGELKAYTSDKCTKFQSYKTPLAGSFSCTGIFDSGDDTGTDSAKVFMKPFMTAVKTNEAPAIDIYFYTDSACTTPAKNSKNENLVINAANTIPNTCHGTPIDSTTLVNKKNEINAKSYYIAFSSANLVLPTVAVAVAAIASAFSF